MISISAGMVWAKATVGMQYPQGNSRGESTSCNYWAEWREADQQLSLAGVTITRFRNCISVFSSLVPSQMFGSTISIIPDHQTYWLRLMGVGNPKHLEDISLRKASEGTWWKQKLWSYQNILQLERLLLEERGWVKEKRKPHLSNHRGNGLCLEGCCKPISCWAELGKGFWERKKIQMPFAMKGKQLSNLYTGLAWQYIWIISGRHASWKNCTTPSVHLLSCFLSVTIWLVQWGVTCYSLRKNST